MKIELHRIPVRDVVDGYVDNKEGGVKGYGGRLDIRPAYQREFIYKDKQRDLVIDSVRKNLPLNVMYWVKTGEDSYEVMDGQQRTISVCSYVNGGFSIDYQFFMNLTKEEQEQILDYEFMVYICEGTDKEKLAWFNIINIAGEKLTKQELRNATYTGPWLTDAKEKFSKTKCPAYEKYEDYMKGVPIRQDYLETALRWIAHKQDIHIEDYMSKNQNSENASELWQYFESVMSWVKIIFPDYRKEMKGVEWGILYNKYGKNQYNATDLGKETKKLMLDEDVRKKSGIYAYLLSGEEKHLNIRTFGPGMRREAYERQDGICSKCGEEFKLKDMEADHIKPWSKGGKTVAENCQMLCRPCNRKKSDK